MYYLSDVHDIVVQLAQRVKSLQAFSGYLVIEEWKKMLSEGVQLTIDFNDRPKKTEDQ